MYFSYAMMLNWGLLLFKTEMRNIRQKYPFQQLWISKLFKFKYVKSNQSIFQWTFAFYTLPLQNTS